MPKRDATKQNLNYLAKTISFLTKTNNIKKFLSDFLTASEIKEIVNRIKVMQMLHGKETYQDIEKIIGTSSATIAKISKAMKNQKSGYGLNFKIKKSKK